MQTALADFIRDTDTGQEANAILRTCVHCGMCNATCPTYQLLGDELDGPRGRIYLIKQMLEGGPVSDRTLTHLDRCLTCRNCETTCPSGVRYGQLLDIGRDLAEAKAGRPLAQKVFRWILRNIIPYPSRFGALIGIGQLLRPILPSTVKRSIPARQERGAWPRAVHDRHMLMLNGCVQPTLAPNINAATARVLDRLGITAIVAAEAGCCGAASHHTSGRDEGLDFARRNIDAWWPLIESGVEAIVMTASGCGIEVKEYAHLLKHDPKYATKAKRVSELTRDVAEVLAKEDLSKLSLGKTGSMKIAFHAPCTLQHGQKLNGVVEKILRGLGMNLVPVADAHLCCGSAGTYSILQKGISQVLLANKIAALSVSTPNVIATANIGCLSHIQSGASLPVRHWIELIDTVLSTR